MGAFAPAARKACRGRPPIPMFGLAVAILGCLALMVGPQELAFLRWIFFPKDMVLIVGLAAVASWWFGYRRAFSDGTIAMESCLRIQLFSLFAY